MDGGLICQVDFHGAPGSMTKSSDGSGCEAGPQMLPRRTPAIGHVLMDNLQGLVVDVKITEATGNVRTGTQLSWHMVFRHEVRITVRWTAGTTPGA